MPYLDTPEWKEVVRGKNLIFDTDAIISILAFNGIKILDEANSLGCTFSYVSPTTLELMSTDSGAEKLRRADLLKKYSFAELPLTPTEIKNALRIQRSIPINIKGKPSPVDYYIGGALLKYVQNGNTYLLTSNVKDYPQPIYTRESFIPLINQTDFKAISVISIDTAKLVEE